VSNKQRLIIIIYLLCVVSICAYVPWTAHPEAKMPAGYAFIFNPPNYFVLQPLSANKIGSKTAVEAARPSLEEIFNGNSNELKKYPISGIDIKIIGVELIGTTALFGMFYIATGLKNNVLHKE